MAEAGRPRHRRIPYVFFAGVTLLYLSLSPLSTEGMGYLGEEMQACRQVLGQIGGAGSAPGASPVVWPRNGAVGLIFQCPFLAVSHALSGSAVRSEERWFEFQPVLAGALLVTILFVWCSRLSESRRWGYALALIAGFCTMIWPYAYIGLETTQSLFLMLAALLAIGSDAPPTWPRSLLFALSAGVAVSAKSGGILLAPAVLFLAWTYFRRGSNAQRPTSGAQSAKALVALAVIAAIFCGNAAVRALTWVQYGGTVSFAKGWLVRDPVSPVLNFIAYFGSPNKGLIVFAPVTILALLAIRRAFAVDRRVAIFALLTLAGFTGSLSFLEMWSDETWGPRYIHSCIGPLILCLAAARRARPARLRTEAPLLAAAALGFGVSVLGMLFYYGTLMGVATATTALTLPALQGDMTWNHVAFNARLLAVWLKQKTGRANAPEFLAHGRLWDFRSAPEAPAWNKVDLREVAHPQPFLLRSLGAESAGENRTHAILAAALAFGLALVAWTGRECLIRNDSYDP